MSPHHILFAEDEAVLGKLVREALEREGDFSVDWAMNGTDALHRFGRQRPDICILDVMMPGMDGFTLARQIRSADGDIPILFLTARSGTADVVRGFEAGGNDYLKKPFSIEELVLRVRELLRRGGKSAGGQGKPKEAETFTIGRYAFLPSAQLLRAEGQTIRLSHKEAGLLRELVLCRNSLMERKAVLMRLWGDDNFFNARNMDVYIGRLRKYLAQDDRLSIVNVRGFGFKLIDQSV